MEQAVRRKHSDEYKREAARNLGTNANMLSRGKHEHERHGEGAFPGKGKMTPEQAELHRLRVENKRLRMERDILKKATAFFDSAHHVPLPLGDPVGRPNGSCFLVSGKRREVLLCGTA